MSDGATWSQKLRRWNIEYYFAVTLVFWVLVLIIIWVVWP